MSMKQDLMQSDKLKKMGASKNLFMETHTEDIDQYFQWLTEKEWREYCDAEIDKIDKQYGNTVTAQLKIMELNKRING